MVCDFFERSGKTPDKSRHKTCSPGPTAPGFAGKQPGSRFLDHSSLAVTTTYLRRLAGQADRGWSAVAGCSDFN
jgi:hypothetical protein